MSQVLQPAVWLIVLIVGLPQLSETVYTPSLPDIARALHASESMVEYTLTIYLFGFAIGTLFWGKLSDKLGRKFCVLAGLFVFVLGCLGCYFSNTIEMLMLSRFVQAFGGSIGSVIGQSICRDAFHGPALGKVYASVGSALALFPALGPVVGGVIAEQFGWNSIFLFLMFFALLLSGVVKLQLPETHRPGTHTQHSFFKIAISLAKDKRVLGFGLIVAGCNGILFSYFAEGSFYLINLLGLTPSQYGFSFILISVATMMGGIVTRRLHAGYSSQTIMLSGVMVIIVSTFIFTAVISMQHSLISLSNQTLIFITVLSQMSSAFGICMATSSALAQALVNYKHAIGTASSLFGFFYYCMISLFTLGMGFLHNGTLFPMPFYFLGLGIMMFVASKLLIK